MFCTSHRKQKYENMESVYEKDLESFSVQELKDELKSRYLPVTGIKNDLIERLIKDNKRKMERKTEDNLLLNFDSSNENPNQIEELQRKIKELESKMQQREIDDTKNESKNKNPNQMEELQTKVMELLSKIVDTQQGLATQSQLTPPSLQVYSTNDTSNAIQIFSGNKMEDPSKWINQIERIGELAKWSTGLMLINASMRLRGPASDWHKAFGKNYNTWLEWKTNLINRFNVKMTFAEFMTYQNRRTLKSTETLTEYIYSKNAIFEKCPTPLTEKDKISLILEGITDEKWCIPLATQCCDKMEDLLNYASSLDNVRKIERFHTRFNPTGSDKVSMQNQNNSKFIPKFNPETDKEEEQTCFRCKKKGHISYNCTLETSKEQKENPKSSKMNTINSKIQQKPETKTNQVSCVQDIEPNVTMIPVTVNETIKLDALPDSGSVITIIDKKMLPENTLVYPWQKGSFKAAGSLFTPIGWLTARVQVGKIDYIMPQIAICKDLPVPMIIGKDWQLAVYARIVYDPDGKICIITPTHTEYFPAIIAKEQSSVACCINQKEIKQPINEEAKYEVEKLVEEYNDIFKNDNNDIGKFSDFELEINLKHEKPISCKPYRLPEPERIFLKETIEKWLEQKICRLSNSPYAAPMFVVQQPFHETTPYRPVVDYSRTINPITILDSQPIERMEDIVTTISQFVYKFKLDIFHAYHNICIRESDIFKTAVITQDYHVEFMRVMFGLVGGPAIMSKVIKSTYGQLYNEGVRAYFDDITGGANTLKEHLQLLRKVFDVTRQKKLKLNKDKCIFLEKEIPLFGKIVGYKEEKVDPKRTSAVDQYDTLSTIGEVRSFLGFTGTFRKYIKNYAVIAKPLQDMLKKNKSETEEKFEVNQKKKKVVLTEEQQNSFLKLKKLVTTAPVLANFQQDAETIVETDSSYQGLGACLIQVQNEERKVIEYASRCLKNAETRYHINELEVTAVHWAVTNKFRIYLLGKKFILVTDSYSTAYIIDKAKLNRKFARYVIDLAPFDFVPVHRPGKQNVIADHLSRYPLKELCMPVVGSNTDKLKLAQSKDPFIQQICIKLSKEANTEHLKQIREVFKIEDDILIHINKEEMINQEKIVVPQSLRSSVIKIAHDDNGHLENETTLTKLRTKYWWKTMRKDVKAYTSSCITCAKTNRRTTLAYGKLCERPMPETPMQVISSDHIVALPPTESGNTYIFVHIDHATRYIFAKPTCSLTAQNVMDTIENDIIYTYGPPLIYISDGAPCFTSNATQNFFAKYGIEHISTTPYTPSSNGLVERANATMVSTLTKYALENKDDWDKLLPKVVLAINTSKQKSTGYSPFYLLHGYEPRIPPNEIHFGTIVEDVERKHQLDILFEDRKRALENIKKVHTLNKRRYDMKHIEDNFNPGDYVVYEWPKPSDTKISPRYKGPFKITKKIGSVCYEIEDLKKPAIKKVVHVKFLKKLPYPHTLDVISDISGDIDENFDQEENETIPQESQDQRPDNQRPDIQRAHYKTRSGRNTQKPDSYRNFHYGT